MKKKHEDDLLVHMTARDLKQVVREESQEVIREYVKPPTPLTIYTVQEASEILKAHVHTLRLYAEKGLIESFNIGNRRYFTLEAINKFIEKKGSQQPTQRRAYCVKS